MLKKLMEWPEWEGINHGIVVLLYVWIIWRLLKNPNELTTTHLIELTIAVSIGTLIHQNINSRNKKYPSY